MNGHGQEGNPGTPSMFKNSSRSTRHQIGLSKVLLEMRLPY